MSLAIGRFRHPAMLVAAAALTAGAPGEAAMGQQYRGDGGTLLDRNNQVGSGGKNVRARDVRDQIWFNNQIITGNAPGGRSFRGYVGYTAPSDFRGTAGSDTNYGFRRDSTSAAAVATGVRASDALRYQFSLTTGQAPPSYLANTLLTRRESAAASASTETSTTGALRSTSEYLTSRSLRPTFVGSRVNAEGDESVASASTLLGISWQRLGDSGRQKSAPKTDALAEPTTPGAPPLPTSPTSTSGPAAPVTPGAPASSPLAPTGLEGRGSRYQSEWDRTVGRDRESAGNQRQGAVDNAVESSAVPARTAAHTQVLEAVRTAYVAPTAEQPASADEAIERIRRVLRGQSPLPPPKADTLATTQPKPDAKPGDEAPADGAADKAMDPTKPTAKPRPGDKDKPEKREPSALSPELLKALKSIGQKNLSTLVPTDAESTNPSSYKVHMEAGQRALGEARYFEAEDRFTRAIAAMPADPLAKIGRVHAQLGAGMFLSASTNLRQLFKDSPEVVGLSYDRKLAPDAARTASVAGQLRENVTQGSTGMGLEASLLLAYLGRITSDPAMVAEGLEAMRLRLPAGDESQAALHTLLSTVWTAEK